MTNVRFDHETLRNTLLRTVADMDEKDSSVDEGTESSGVDPAVTAALVQRRKDTKKKAKDTGEDAETSNEANDTTEEQDKAGADRTSGTNTELGGSSPSTTSPSSTTSTPTATQTTGDTTGSVQPVSNVSNNTAANNLGSTYNPFQSSTPMTQVSPYSNGYTPTPSTATQYDLNNAPNKQALAEAIYQAVKYDAWNSGDAGDTRPNKGGGDAPQRTGNADDDAVLDIIDKYVNSEPPIPYAWGGGHGGEPGMSQGISDGGGQADKMGDYDKTGLDCSGFARVVVYEATGQDLAAGTAETQYNTGQPTSDPRPGDLVFPQSAGRPPQHVQVYVGDGRVAEAQQSGTYLLYSNLQEGSEFRRF